MRREPEENQLWVALTLMVVFGAVGFTIVAVNVGEDFAIPVGIVAFVAAAIVLRGPVGKALARRLEGKTEPNDTESVLQALDEVARAGGGAGGAGGLRRTDAGPAARTGSSATVAASRLGIAPGWSARLTPNEQ